MTKIVLKENHKVYNCIKTFVHINICSLSSWKFSDSSEICFCLFRHNVFIWFVPKRLVIFLKNSQRLYLALFTVGILSIPFYALPQLKSKLRIHTILRSRNNIVLLQKWQELKPRTQGVKGIVSTMFLRSYRTKQRLQTRLDRST